MTGSAGTPLCAATRTSARRWQLCRYITRPALANERVLTNIGGQVVLKFKMQHCANSGGGLKIVAANLEQPVIEKVLTHRGLQAKALSRLTARGHALQAT